MKTNFLFWTAIIAVVSAVSCNSKSDEVLAVRLDQPKIELVKGESVQLNASVVPAQDVEFTWFSQDDNYVTVDQNGLVTAVALKKEADEVKPVSVYAKYMNGAAECQVTVLPLAPSKVEIDYDSNKLVLEPAQTYQLKVNFTPADTDITDLTWTTDYASVATVDSKTGLVTGVAPGWAVIRASYNDKIYDEIDVQVSVVNPTAVVINPAELTLEVGQKHRLKTVFTPSNASGNAVWTSDKPAVVTVDNKTGAIEAKSAGTANVKVQVGECSAICKVTVK